MIKANTASCSTSSRGTDAQANLTTSAVANLHRSTPLLDQPRLLRITSRLCTPKQDALANIVPTILDPQNSRPQRALVDIIQDALTLVEECLDEEKMNWDNEC